MTTQERNILMAEFKGWTYNEETEKFTKGGLVFRLASFEYDQSWDILAKIILLCNRRVQPMGLCPEDKDYEYFDQGGMKDLVFDFNDMIKAYGLALVGNDITQAHKITAEWIIKYNELYDNAKQLYDAEKYDDHEEAI